MIIVLLGYMGVGKTTIGVQLASILQYEFIDLDEFIENKENSSVSDIFKDKGEIYFRKQEHLYLKEIIASKARVVLSLGGGTPCYANNMKLVAADNVSSFYLQMNPKLLANRLFKERSKRPLIALIPTIDKLMEFIGIHLFERQAFYTLADTTISLEGLSIDETVENIVKKLY